jgi:phenylacetate-CoA ligase
MVAYETPAREGLVVNEDMIVEIVRPGTGEPVPDGEVGEVVVTGFNADYPLVRFATGDLSAILPGASPCGRTNARIRGWMGRADQATKVRGMFVHPQQVAEVLRRHGLARGRLVVENEAGEDRMTLHVEGEGAGSDLVRSLEATLREVMKLRGAIAWRPAGSLPNDGKVIEDARRYS